MIKFLVMDVDGTLTDGKIYMGEAKEIFKAFDVKDGCGIHDILPMYHIVPVIITARTSKIIENRCRELGVIELYQGIRDKAVILEQILGRWSEKEKICYKYENVAYIGDDILDVQCMKSVREQGGVVGCPADAVSEVREIADFISTKHGGDGAVREFIEYITINH